MVRAIHADLLTAQNAATNTPYIYLLFTSADGNTTYNYSSDQASRRILSIDHQEEPYNDYASIILRDDDKSIPDLKGYWTEIGYGYVSAGDVNRYSQTARLWVKHQQEINAQGRRVVLLELEGMWAKAREMPIRIGNPPFYTDEDEELISITPYAAITRILTEISMTLATLAEDDGIMGTLSITKFYINNLAFESAGPLLYRLINMTKSYLRSKASLEFEVKYPQTSDAEDLSYYSDQAPYFYEYMERRNVLIPNHVYCFANEGTDGLWADIITGEATDATEIAAYGTVPRIVVAPDITTQADADNRAASVLTRGKMEALAGRMYAPHDCQVELYDKIGVYDRR